MKTAKRKRLEENGWKVGSAADFLNLSPEEAEYVDFKLAASKALQDLRKISFKNINVQIAVILKKLVKCVIQCITNRE